MKILSLIALISLLQCISFSGYSQIAIDVDPSSTFVTRYHTEQIHVLSHLDIMQENYLIFPHHADIDLDLLFENTLVKKWKLDNDTLIFTPLVNQIALNYPGLSTSKAIINNNNFRIVKPQQNKSVMGIVTIDGDSPSFLIEQILLGDVCLDIENVSAPGGSSGYGQFYGGESSILVESGIILATGNISTSHPPNNATGSSSTVGTAGSDPDLAQLTSGTLNDVAILEFDFVPDEDSIAFEYVFASEEYCDFVNSSFNDVFGFFLSGPGISGPYTNNAANIALIPGTNTPVTINNVNWLTNGEFYTTNVVYEGVGGSCTQEEIDEPDKYADDLEYDGFTTVLTASAEVVPCEVYHIKIAIADVGDGAWDSAVFLGRNTFVSGSAGIRVLTEVGYTDPVEEAAVEGCEGAFIAFTKSLANEPITIYINVENSSTATEDVDYLALPDSFVMGTGLIFDTLWLDIFNDILVEGEETINITLSGICECVDPQLEIVIKDPNPLVITPLEDQGFCDPQNITLSTGATGGNPPYTYEWSTGTTGPTTSFTFQNTGFYYVTIMDDCGQTEFDTAYVELYPNYAFSDVIEICEGDFYFVGGANQSIAGNYLDNFPTINDCDSIRTTQLVVKPKSFYDTLIYSCANEPVFIGDETINVPGVSDVIFAGMATNGCDSVVTVEVEWLSPVSSIFDPDVLNCLVDSVQLLTIVPNVGDGFEFFWDGPNGFFSNEEHPFVFEPGDYTLTVTQTINGVFCESFFPFSTEVILDTLAPVLDVINDITISCGLNNATISANVLNADDILNLHYVWNGPNGFTSDQSTVTVGDSGLYEVIVTNVQSGCIAVNPFLVIIDDIEPEIIGFDSALGCDADSIQIFSDVNLLNGIFSWTGPNNYTSNEQDPFVYSSGEYIVEYSLSPSCIASDTVIVTIDNTVPEISAFGDTIICSQGMGDLGTIINSDYNTIEWLGPNNFSSDDALISVQDEGAYTVIVTGINGCISEETVNLVFIEIEPEVTVSNDVINCGELSIEVDISTAGNGLTFDWDGPNNFSSNIESPTISDPGIYTVLVTNEEGCSVDETITIEADTLIPVVSIDPQIITCSNSEVNLNVYDVSENLTFDWTGPQSFSSNSEDVVVEIAGNYTLIITSDNGCQNSYDVQVAIDTITPVFTALGDTLDCNEGTALLSSNATGANLLINWLDEDNGIVGLNANELVGSSGLYSIVVTNLLNGCSTTEQVEIFANVDVPDLSANGDTINCLSNEFYITSSSNTPNVIYNWEGPNAFTSTNDIVEITEQGIYTVTITSPNGCIAIESVEVLLDNNSPVLTTENDLLNCVDTLTSLALTASGINNIFTWEGPNSFSSNDPNPITQSPGVYTVTVTSGNGCSSEQELTIFQDINYPTVDLSLSNQLNCFDPESTILSLSNAPNGSSFVWLGPNNFSSNFEDIIINEPGTYELTVTGLNGCSETSSIDVSQDTTTILLSAQDYFIDCFEPQTSLDISYSNLDIFDIQWSGPDNYSSVQLNPVVNNGGTYDVIVTANNGCTTAASIEITNNISYPDVDLNGSSLDCENPSVDIAAILSNGDLNLNWSDENNTPLGVSNFIEVFESGKYFVEVIDNTNGCISVDSIVIEQLPELISFDFDVDNPNCNISSGTVNFTNVEGGTGPFMYSIDGGTNFSENINFSNLDGGEYEIMVMDSRGCELVGLAEIVGIESYDIDAEDLYVEVLGSELTLDVTTSIPQEDILSISWTPSDGLSCSDCLSPTLTATNNQFYTVTVIDQNGCELTEIIELRVADNPIYVPNIFSPNDDGVNDIFTLYGDLETIVRINDFRIYDRWGNNVFRAEDQTPDSEELSWDGSFNGQSVKSDVFAYYIMYTSIDGTIKKIVGDVTVIR